MRAVLGNVERMEWDYPGFEAPPARVREGLEPGDLAELMLLSEEMDPQAIWTEVDDVLGPGWYRGVLESGEPVEFGSEHVSDILRPGGGGELGASIFDPREEQPLRGKPPIWLTKEHAAWVEAERKKKAAEPRRSLWDIFRRKPKVEVTPIPEVERRKAPRSIFPKPVEIFEETPPSIQVPPEAAAQAIIVPAPREEKIIEGAPVSFMEVLGPTPPPAPPAPRGLVPVETQDVFGILAPEAPPRPPSGLVVPEIPGTLAPAGAFDPFKTLEAAPQELAPFQVPPMLPAEPAFETFVPEAGGLIAKPSMELESFDVLPPQGIAPYARPEAPAFGVFAGEPEEEPGEEKRKPRKLKMSVHSSQKSWEEWIRENFVLEDVWNHVREARRDPWHLHNLAHEEDTGIEASIGIQTWDGSDWHNFSKELGIPYKVLEPYVKKMEEEAEENGYWEETWEDFDRDVIFPVSEAIEAAFDALKPPDLIGRFFLDWDRKWDGDVYGIVYYEPISDEEKNRIRGEEKVQAEKERREQGEREQREKELEKTRKREIRKIWGKLPEVDEVVPWVEQMFGEEFWRSMKRNQKSEGFQHEIEVARENAIDAVMEVEPVAEEGPELYAQLSTYFGIPTEIFDVFFKSAPFDEAQNDLWSEVLYPYFAVVDQAMNALKPKSLPGWFEFSWDDDEQEFLLKYIE